jgi:uncharacterized protein YegL
MLVEEEKEKEKVKEEKVKEEKEKIDQEEEHKKVEARKIIFDNAFTELTSNTKEKVLALKPQLSEDIKTISKTLDSKISQHSETLQLLNEWLNRSDREDIDTEFKKKNNAENSSIFKKLLLKIIKTY